MYHTPLLLQPSIRSSSRSGTSLLHGRDPTTTSLSSSLSPIVLAYGASTSNDGGVDDWEDEEEGFEQNDEDLVLSSNTPTPPTTTPPPQQQKVVSIDDVNDVQVSNIDIHAPLQDTTEPTTVVVEDLETLPGFVQEAVTSSSSSSTAPRDEKEEADTRTLQSTTTTTTIINPPVPIPLLTEEQRRHSIQLATWLTKDALESASPTMTIPPLDVNETIEEYMAQQQARSLVRRQLMKRAAQAHPLGAAAIFGAGMSDMSDGKTTTTNKKKGEEVAASSSFPIAPNNGPIYSPLPFIHIPPRGGGETSVQSYSRIVNRKPPQQQQQQQQQSVDGSVQPVHAQFGDVVGVDVTLRVSSETATRRVIVVNGGDAGGVRTVDVAGRAAGTIPASYHTRHPVMENDPVRPARSTPSLYHIEHDDDDSRPSLQQPHHHEDDDDDVRTQGEFYGSRWLQIPLLMRHRSGELLREKVMNYSKHLNHSTTLNTSASINELVVASQRGIREVLDSFLVLAATHSHHPSKEEEGSGTHSTLHLISSASLSAVEDVAYGMSIGEERAAIVPSILAYGIHGHPSMGIEPLEEGLVLTIKLKSIVRIPSGGGGLIEYSEAHPHGKAISGIDTTTTTHIKKKRAESQSGTTSQSTEQTNADDDTVITAEASLSELPVEDDNEDDAAATLGAMMNKHKKGKSGGKIKKPTPSSSYKHSRPSSGRNDHDLGATTESVIFTNDRHKTVVERVDRRTEAAKSKSASGAGPIQFIKSPEDDTLDTGEVDGAAMAMRLGSGKRGQTLKHVLLLSLSEAESTSDTHKPTAATTNDRSQQQSVRGRSSPSRHKGRAVAEHGKFPSHTSSYQQHGYNINRGAHAFFAQATEQQVLEMFNLQQKKTSSSNTPKTTVDMILLTGRNSDHMDVARLNRISEELYYHNDHHINAATRTTSSSTSSKAPTSSSSSVTPTTTTTSHLDNILVGDMAQVGPILFGLHGNFGNVSQLFTPSSTANKWHGGLVGGGLESCCDALNRQQYNPTSLTSIASCVGEHIPHDQLPHEVVSQYTYCSHPYPLSLLSSLARSTTTTTRHDAGSESTLEAEYHPQQQLTIEEDDTTTTPPFPLYPLDAYLRVPHGAADDQTEKAWRWSRNVNNKKKILLDGGDKLISFKTTASLRYHYTSQYGTTSKLLNLTRTSVKQHIKDNTPRTTTTTSSSSPTSPPPPPAVDDMSLVSGSHLFIVVRSEQEVSSSLNNNSPSSSDVEKERSIEVLYIGNVPSSLQGWRRLTSWTEQWAAIMKSTINSSMEYRHAVNRHEAAQQEATKKLAQDITAPRVISPHIHDLKGTANKIWSNLVNSKRIQMSVQDSFFTVFNIQPVISYHNATTVHISASKPKKQSTTSSSTTEGATTTDGEDMVKRKATTTDGNSGDNKDNYPPSSINNRKEMKDVVSGEYYMNVPHQGLPEGLSTLVDPALPSSSPPYHRQWCSYRRLNDCNDLLYAWDKGAISTSQFEQALLLDHRGHEQSRQHGQRVKGLLSGSTDTGGATQQLLFAHMCPQPYLLFFHSVSVSGKEAAIKELRYVYSEVVNKYPTLKAKGWVPLEEDQDVKDAIEEAAQLIYGRSSTAPSTPTQTTQYTPHSIFSLYSQKESGGRLAAQDAEALQRVLTPRLREQFRERSEDREVEYGYNMGIITEGMMQALGQPVI